MSVSTDNPDRAFDDAPGILPEVRRLGAELVGTFALPHDAASVSLFLEAVRTFILVLVVLGTATQHRVVGPNAALAVGAIIAAGGVARKSISGASMNPGRSLGPVIVSGYWAHAWIYVFGPAFGAVLAVVITTVIHGPRRRGEGRAASGSRAHKHPGR